MDVYWLEETLLRGMEDDKREVVIKTQLGFKYDEDQDSIVDKLILLLFPNPMDLVYL